MNLYDANHQWANRPDDERFASLQEMYDATKKYAFSATTGTSTIGQLRVENNNDNLHLVGSTGKYAKLTHYSFGQLARFAKAPAEYLRKLPSTLAMQNLNYGLKNADQADKLSLLFHQNGNLVARAITSDNYDRVWNYQVISRVMDRLIPNGWVVPPARPCRDGQAGTRRATAADILPNQADFGLAVKEGDLIAPAGLYASDHDMFAFLVNQSDAVWDGAKFLNRGVFIQNSEVGDCSLKFKLFTYDNVCGNHIVWGAGKVTEVAIRHVKGETQAHGKTLANAMAKWNILMSKMPTPAELEANIQTAKERELGANKEEVLDAAFAFGKTKSLSRLSRATLEAGYDIAATTPRYGSPRSIWGLVNGLTEYSQTGAVHTDDRTELDLQAGRLMEIAF